MNKYLTALALGAATSLLHAEESVRPPNIIFIMADDLGWRDSAVYGSEFYQTPGIDRLASEGVLFTDAYSASPLCSPTRASCLTGQYPGRLGLTLPVGHLEDEILEPTLERKASPTRSALTPNSLTRLPNEYVTYAELLHDAGYATAFIGKWHLGRDPYIPDNQGFDKVVSGRYFPGPPPPGGHFAPWDVDTLPKKPEGTHISDVLTDEAISFIKEHRDQPFLINLWFHDVHAPFQAKPELVNKYKTLVDPDYPQHSPTMGAMIEVMDTNIGRLLDELDVLGLRDETIIIFFSDNGGNMYNKLDGTTPTNNAPLRSGKGNNYEGGVRVPLIVSWPGVSQPGTRSDAVISSVDMYPTILRMAGLPLHPEYHLDGVDFSAAIRGQAFDRGPIFSDFPHYIVATDNLPSTSVRAGDYKLYRFYCDGERQADRYELYNLKNDIGETHNLADEMPDKVAELNALIETHLRAAGVLIPVPNPGFAGDPVLGWKILGDVELEANGDTLKVISSGIDPRFTTENVGGLEGPVTVEFSMRSNSKGKGQIFWLSDDEKKYDKTRSVSFIPNHDGNWHQYRVELPVSGRLSALRLDPSQASGRIEITGFQMLDTSGRSVHPQES